MSSTDVHARMFNLDDYLPPTIPDYFTDRPKAAVLVSSFTSADQPKLDDLLTQSGFQPLGGSQILLTGVLIAERLPRKVPWNAYPIIGGPYWRLTELRIPHPWDFSDDVPCSPSGKMRGMPGSERRALDIIKDADAVILVGPAYSDRTLDLHRLFEIAGLAPRPSYATRSDSALGRFTPLESLKTDLEMVSLQAAAKRPLDRFMWSYKVNFSALGQKALAAADERWAVFGDAIEDGSLEDRPHMGLMCDPWAVQLLFALRRYENGSWSAPALPSMDNRTSLRGYADFPGVCLDPDAKSLGFELRGSGTWPAWTLSKEERLRVDRVCRTLFVTSLVARPSSEFPGPNNDFPARLTPLGRAFLDILPSAFEDPDVMLRWRGRDGLPAPEDVPAMDRWINNVFRKLKKRLNEIRPEKDGSGTCF